MMELEMKARREKALETIEKAKDLTTYGTPRITRHGRGDDGAIGTTDGLGAIRSRGTAVLRKAIIAGATMSAVGVAALETTRDDRPALGARQGTLTLTRSMSPGGTAPHQ